MRTLSFILLTLILVTCKKESEPKLLEIQTFELDDCFSTLSLYNAEIAIWDKKSYLEFQDSIRRHFNPACELVGLPEVDFNTNFFIGVFTSATGCSAEYSRELYYNQDNDSYEYKVKANGIGDCEMVISSFNCAIALKQSESKNIDFLVSKN
jgi:hypothetical protein